MLVVHSIDRLARNLADLLRIVTDPNGRGVAVEFCKEHLEFAGDASPMSHLMLSIIGACAQFERDTAVSKFVLAVLARRTANACA